MEDAERFVHNLGNKLQTIIADLTVYSFQAHLEPDQSEAIAQAQGLLCAIGDLLQLLAARDGQ